MYPGVFYDCLPTNGLSITMHHYHYLSDLHFVCFLFSLQHNGTPHSNEHLMMLDFSPEEAGVYARVKDNIVEELKVVSHQEPAQRPNTTCM